MQSIFKKTLLAAAVAGVASVNAATITGNGGADSALTKNEWPLVSAEGLAVAGEISIGTDAGDIQVEFATTIEYAGTDRLVFTITGAQVDTSDSSPQLIDTTSGDEVANIGFISASNNADANTATVVFRATDGTVDGGFTADLTGVVLTDLASVVSISSAGVLLGDDLGDDGNIDQGASTNIAAVGTQFGFAAGDDAFDAVVSVEDERKEFVTGTDDNFTLDVTSAADLLSVDLETYTVAVTSQNLSFLADEDGELVAATYELDGETEDADESALSDDGTTLTVVSSTANAGDNTVGITFTPDGEAVLTPQDYSASLSATYSLMGGTPESVVLGTADVGSWGLSGAMINIPFLPYGSGISQILHISNSGSVSGDIELTAFDSSGNSYGPVTLNVSAAAGSVTRLNGAVQTALLDAGFSGSGNIDLTLTVNSPAADIDVFGAYNARGDRVAVQVIPLSDD